MEGSKTRTSSIETVATSWYEGPMGEELIRVQEKRYLCGLVVLQGKSNIRIGHSLKKEIKGINPHSYSSSVS